MAALQPTQAVTTLPFAANAVYTLPLDDKAESAKIMQLITYIKTLEGASFIRNGSKYSCEEAAKHLQSKWEKHNDKIKTAEEFIQKLASHSGMSGEEYQIQFADGTTKPTAQVLLQELNRLQGK